MKKILVVCIMLFMITGCGNSEIKDLDINKASAAIEQTLSNMEAVDADMLVDVYNMDLGLFESYVVKQNSEGNMYAIVLTNNKSEAKEQFEKYFEKVRDFNVAYSPEQVKLIDEHLEKEIGNYLIYIVAENNENIYQDIINTVE